MVSLTLDPVIDSSTGQPYADSSPHLGDTVTFTNDGHGNKSLRVLAYQNGNVVYVEDHDDGESFLLGAVGSEWLTNGGPADCHAELYIPPSHGGKPAETLATLDFAAGDRRV